MPLPGNCHRSIQVAPRVEPASVRHEAPCLAPVVEAVHARAADIDGRFPRGKPEAARLADAIARVGRLRTALRIACLDVDDLMAGHD
jgi:hypothetical protein